MNEILDKILPYEFQPQIFSDLLTYSSNKGHLGFQNIQDHFLPSFLSLKC